jgi:ketosteroid isomerase-like protein
LYPPDGIIRIWRVSLVPLLGLGVACAPPSSKAIPDSAQAVAELRGVDSLVQAAIVARDAERTASFYAEEAVLMPVAESIIEGRTAILAEWRHVFGIPGYENRARLVAADVSAGGDLGYTRGTYESPMLGPDGQSLLERGKWVSIWKRQGDGQWRIVVDIFNTDTPPPIHAPSTVKPGPP